MSYFPDYRKETDKLNEVDRAAITGFRIAFEVASNLIDQIIEESNLSIERELAEIWKARFEEWAECEEKEFVCSLFDNADYLPDDIELEDANKGFGR